MSDDRSGDPLPEANEALEKLAAWCGIEAAHFDIWGRLHRVSDATRRALLVSMGVAAGSDAALPGELARFERASWTRMLPPVQVTREAPSAPIAVLLTYPDTGAEQALEWVLRLETGDIRVQGFQPNNLEMVEQRSIDGEPHTRRRLTLDQPLPLGYHRLAIRRPGIPGDVLAEMHLIVVPTSCHRPHILQAGGREWGLSAQLYALRSRANWGIGDFGDLVRLIDFCAEQGGGLIGLNPLHALFPARPDEASPYGPSSRSFLNVMYLDVEAVAEFAECAAVRDQVNDDGFRECLRRLRESDRVDHVQVAAVKFAVLEQLYTHFRDQHLATGSERGRAYRSFLAEQGRALQMHALHDALQAHLAATDPGMWGWPVWPAEFRDPESAAVESFRRSHADRVDFHAWLQWLAHQQLNAASRHAQTRGLEIGLMTDLAIGASAVGSDVWVQREVHATAAGIGAPPDDFNPNGQNWGLAPMNPHRLREAGYAPFIDAVRASMREAGALRIDHVMGLQRVYWIPDGASPAEGAYVRYPVEDLLGIIALESVRNRCMVVGEDLGTVPEGFRETVRARGLLSYRLLYFEREADGEFAPPSHHPRESLVMVGTHDLPTLAGFWAGRDLDLRAELGLSGSPSALEVLRETRRRDRERLLAALQREDLASSAVIEAQRDCRVITAACAAAAHAYLARSPAMLMLIQTEDLLAQVDQVNVPATTAAQHPNWQRKLPLEIERWHENDIVSGVLDAVRAERGRAVP